MSNGTESPALRLRRFREVNQLSQADLGQLLGCSKFRISKIENGHERPGFDLAVAIQRRLGIPADVWIELPEDLPDAAEPAATGRASR